LSMGEAGRTWGGNETKKDRDGGNDETITRGGGRRKKKRELSRLLGGGAGQTKWKMVTHYQGHPYFELRRCQWGGPVPKEKTGKTKVKNGENQ